MSALRPPLFPKSSTRTSRCCFLLLEFSTAKYDRFQIELCRVVFPKSLSHDLSDHGQKARCHLRSQDFENSDRLLSATRDYQRNTAAYAALSGFYCMELW